MVKNMIGAIICLLSLNPINAQDPDLYFRDQQLKKQEDEKIIANWPLDPTTKQILFSEVINVDNASSQDLYSRGKLFVANAYKSSNSVTQLNDDQAKIILIKPVISVQYKDFWVQETYYVRYQLKIECKDNRYRYSVEGHTILLPGTKSAELPFSFIEKKPAGFSKKSWMDVQNQALTETKMIINFLKSTMNKAVSDF